MPGRAATLPVIRRVPLVLVLTTLVLLPLAAPVVGRGQPFVQEGSASYNARFTFSRIRYASGGNGFRGGGASWAHDYPLADENISTVLREISILRPKPGPTNVFDLEDPALFYHPIIYMSEPGYWRITEQGARNLRAYLLKGGFIIFDDFEDTGSQWAVFEASFRQALPDHKFIEIGVEHPIFHSFFDLKKLDTPHPLVRVTPVYLGVFEDDDPSKRMLAMVNLNGDLAEYWEWTGRGFFPIDDSNDAYKLGVNYIFYGLTH